MLLKMVSLGLALSLNLGAGEPKCENLEVITEFRDGTAKFMRDGKVGVVDENCKILLDAEFDEISEFLNNGLAYIKNDAKMGLTTKDVVLISPVFESIGEFKNGVTIVKIDEKYGLIREDIVIILNAYYDEILEVEDGIYRVKDGKKIFFIDKDGNEIKR